MNCKAYVAVNERTGIWYAGEKLMEAIRAIAKPIDFGAYGLPDPDLPGLSFFEIGNSQELRNFIIAQKVNSTIAIGSIDNHPRIIKARLEARAEDLVLEEVG